MRLEGPKGIRGALATTAGQSFTGIVLAISLAVFYVKSQGNVLITHIMKGVGAAVVGLFLAIIFKMARNTINDTKTALFALTAFVALAVFRINPIALIMASGITGLLVYGRKA